MDLISIINEKIRAAGPGDHTKGLEAVFLHIKTASAHLERGQSTGDDTAYTDAIYRCNQAFEGALKEAYRIVAEKDPERKTPYEIESYLTEQNILRARILSQLKLYRTDWRNPSTHDYKLDFDNNEALLAIVSVSAFTIVLLDQILEKIAHDEVARNIEQATIPIDSAVGLQGLDLAKFAASVLRDYFNKSPALRSEGMSPDQNWAGLESVVLGSISGALDVQSIENKILVRTNVVSGSRFQADAIVESGNERILIEIKSKRTNTTFARALEFIDRYGDSSDISAAILFFYGHSNMLQIAEEVTPKGRRVLVIGPERSAQI